MVSRRGGREDLRRVAIPIEWVAIRVGRHVAMSMVLVESSSIDDILGREVLGPDAPIPRLKVVRTGTLTRVVHSHELSDDVREGVDSDEITKNSTDPPRAFGPRDWDPYWRVGP